MVTHLGISLTFLLAVCSAWEPTFHLGRRKGGNKIPAEDIPLEPIYPAGPAGGYGPKEGYISQRVDHFNTNDQRTWSQRYFENLNFISRDYIDVAFLNLGGEGPESIEWVKNTNLPWLQWATTYRAAVFSLEHRFYGKSRPFDNQTVENLQYLSSRQALADAAQFIRSMTKEHNMINVRWIVFGGSYSGALALWMRQEYPDLVNGAVGSSAPVQATFDFYDYLGTVQNSLGYEYAGGSANCVAQVKIAFDEVAKLMNTKEGRATLSTTFDLQPAFDAMGDQIGYNDIQNFFSTLYGNFQGAVQYSGDNAGDYSSGYGITDVCKKMIDNTAETSSEAKLKGLQVVNEYMNTMYGMNFTGTANNYTDMIDYLSIEDFETGDAGFDSGARSWTWQTCTEFGYFQSTDVKEDLVFGPVTPVNMFTNMCQDVFGPQFTSDYIEKAVAATNQYYGGADGYRGTNVVIPNGNVDPWSALGKKTSSDPSVVPYLMNGTAHCADMYPMRSHGANFPNLNTVHKIINQNLWQWINGPASNKTINTTTAWLRPKEAVWENNRAKRAAGQFQAKETVETDNRPSRFAKFHMGRPPHGLKPAPDMADAVPQYSVQSFYQPVDHFDNTNPNTFEQRVFENKQWYREGGPMFLMIGGEGPESANWVTNGNLPYLQWAKELGAHVYLLEHRYYGDSTIGQNGENQTMTYLSSLQMLYDVANFIKTTNYLRRNTQPWIVFGGSYSGAMALWMRQMFPDLVAGAVGSSGPIQAKVDFYEYLQVVEASIRSYSDECAENIRTAFDIMHTKMLTAEGRTYLTNTFTLVPAFNETTLTEIDKQFFFSNIFGQFQGAVQYSGDNSGGYASSYGIPYMCSFMLRNQTEQTDPLQNIKDFNVAMTEFYTGANFTQTDNSYSDFVHYLKTGGGPDGTPGDAASKYWTWQTCTEFGYFQSTDLGSNIFGSPTPVNLYTQMCRDVFGPQYNGENVAKAVKATNYKYGGVGAYKGTNVVIPNGSIDPWHALGKYQGRYSDNSAVVVFINGTAHCADMYPARDSDLASLTAARKIIGQNVAAWVKGGAPVNPTDPDSPTTPDPTDPNGTGSPNTPAPETTTKAAATWQATVTLTAAILLLH